MQFKNWIIACCVEDEALLHGPSANSVIVSESFGENTLNVRTVQFVLILLSEFAGLHYSHHQVKLVSW